MIIGELPNIKGKIHNKPVHVTAVALRHLHMTGALSDLAMNKIEKAKLVADTLKLTDGEFSELIYELINSRIEPEIDRNGEVLEDKLALVKFLYGTIDGKPDDEVEPYFVALPKENSAQGELCQLGKCKQCNALLTSTHKFVICPVCRTESHCS